MPRASRGEAAAGAARDNARAARAATGARKLPRYRAGQQYIRRHVPGVGLETTVLYGVSRWAKVAGERAGVIPWSGHWAVAGHYPHQEMPQARNERPLR